MCAFPEKFWTWVSEISHLLLSLGACSVSVLVPCAHMHAVSGPGAENSHCAQLRLIRFFFPVAGSMMLCGRASFFRSGPRQLGVSLAGSSARFGGIEEVLATGEDTLDSADGVCGG